MPKISINLLRYNTSFEDIRETLSQALAQDFDDYELVYSENAPAGKPKLIDQVRDVFGGSPKLRIVDNGDNLGYAGGHNKFFTETNSELLMVLNPDALLHPSYLSEIVKAFDDPKVAGASGKMVKPQKNEKGETILDGTGIIVYKSRRGRERGQLEVDRGQYDGETDVFGVSGTAAVYRRSALLAAEILGEFFDPDFFAYWEDLDLSWRLRLQGYNLKYVPTAIVDHGRAVGSSEKGYKDVVGFVKHHSQFSLNVRRWNWRNHLFCVIKNDFGWAFWSAFPLIFLREFLMLGYITVFETRTLGAVPDFFRLLPRMLRKRKIIQANKKVTSAQMAPWFRKWSI